MSLRLFRGKSHHIFFRGEGKLKKYMMRLISFVCVFCFLSVTAFAEDSGESSSVEVLNGIASEIKKDDTDNESENMQEGFPVEISARSAILVEVSSGTVLAEYNADERLFPASVTKIMTILLVAESLEEGKISLTDEVTCSKNAASKGGSEIWLEEGEIMTVDDLLKATVIGSANDAATLLGEYVSGSEEAFVKLMNTRAKELNMTNTVFENATGLDDTAVDHKTTARDIAVMSCELLKHDLIKNYSTVWMDSLRDGKTELVNTNKLVRFYKGTTGLKTGTTDKAGCCISASAERDGLHLAAVVMGSNTSTERFEAAKSMLSWGFANYSVVTPEADLSLITDVKVLGGEKTGITPEVPKLSPVIVKKGDEDKIEQEVELSVDTQAPVLKGQALGKIKLKLNGGVICEYNIVSPEEVKELTFLTSVKRLSLFLLNGKCDYD